MAGSPWSETCVMASVAELPYACQRSVYGWLVSWFFYEVPILSVLPLFVFLQGRA
jgi:hypothetical protein